MIKLLLIKPTYKERLYILEVADKGLLDKREKQPIINMPTKLPMVPVPKPYSKDALAGYLLNDEKFTDELFVNKHAYGIRSELSEKNKIYDMLNNISSTPFKINKPLLDYITTNGIKHGLLTDPTVKHKYADLDKRTKPQQKSFAAHNSKLIL